jgi:hypothetical protein
VDYIENEYDAWSQWFSRLYVWEGKPPAFERVAWIKVTGVPISLWDRHVFDCVGERCGRLLAISEALPEDLQLSGDIMVVLVHSPCQISQAVTMKWRDQEFEV